MGTSRQHWVLTSRHKTLWKEKGDPVCNSLRSLALECGGVLALDLSCSFAEEEEEAS